MIGNLEVRFYPFKNSFEAAFWLSCTKPNFLLTNSIGFETV